MTGLVERLQRDSIDPSVSVSNLLRSVKLTAVKLGITKTEDWVEAELMGYVNTEVPSYRLVFGQPKAYNPYRGWIPIGGDPDTITRISTLPTHQSIPELESIVTQKRSDSSGLHLPYPPEIISYLNSRQSTQFHTMALFTDVSQIVGIIETVRDLVLNWSIELEKNGILGEGLSFSKVEKDRAMEAGVTINIDRIGSFVGNLGSGNTTGNITVGNIDIEQSRSILKQIRQYQADIVRNGVSGAVLDKLLTNADAELSQATPDDGKVRGLLTDIRNTLSGAAGNLIASGAITAIGKILGC